MDDGENASVKSTSTKGSTQFIECWKLNEENAAYLRQLPDDIKKDCLRNFVAGKEIRDVNKRFIAFAKSRVNYAQKDSTQQDSGAGAEKKGAASVRPDVVAFCKKWKMGEKSSQILNQLPPKLFEDVANNFDPRRTPRNPDNLISSFTQSRVARYIPQFAEDNTLGEASDAIVFMESLKPSFLLDVMCNYKPREEPRNAVAMFIAFASGRVKQLKTWEQSWMMRANNREQNMHQYQQFNQPQRQATSISTGKNQNMWMMGRIEELEEENARLRRLLGSRNQRGGAPTNGGRPFNNAENFMGNKNINSNINNNRKFANNNNKNAYGNYNDGMNFNNTNGNVNGNLNGNVHGTMNGNINGNISGNANHFQGKPQRLQQSYGNKQQQQTNNDGRYLSQQNGNGRSRGFKTRPPKGGSQNRKMMVEGPHPGARIDIFPTRVS